MKKKYYWIIGIIVLIIILIVGYFGYIIYLLTFHPSSIISITNKSLEIKSSSLTVLSADCCASGNGCTKGSVHIKIRWDYSGDEKIYGYGGMWEIELLQNDQIVSHDKMNQPLFPNSISEFDFSIMSVPNVGEYNITLIEKGKNITLQSSCYAT